MTGAMAGASQNSKLKTQNSNSYHCGFGHDALALLLLLLLLWFECLHNSSFTCADMSACLSSLNSWIVRHIQYTPRCMASSHHITIAAGVLRDHSRGACLLASLSFLPRTRHPTFLFPLRFSHVVSHAHGHRRFPSPL